MAETQTAYARSAYSDPLNIINFVALALTLPEIREIVPLKYAPLVAAIVALANLATRIGFVTHPVANIAPGQVKPVEVKKLEATKAGSEEPSKLPQAVQDKSDEQKP
jgi:hypothetical protein